MQINMCIPIEKLIIIRRDDQAESVYSVHNDFILSWTNHRTLSVTARQQMPDLAETGKMLGLLWEHQMHSIEEWYFIQIALNRSGCICFLCHIQENSELDYDHITRIVKMIEGVLQSQIRKVKYP
jgi:hypothetical protein